MRIPRIAVVASFLSLAAVPVAEAKGPTPDARAKAALLKDAISVVVYTPDGDPLLRPALDVVCTSGDAAAGAIASWFRRVAMDDPRWERIGTRLPRLLAPARTAWWKAVRPNPRLGGFDNDGLRLTAAIGGGGGEGFRVEASGILVGFAFTTTDWDGHRILRSVQPIFRDGDRTTEGRTLGFPNGEPMKVLAPDGYAIGGLWIRGGHRVDGFAPLFLKVAAYGLDRDDAIVGPWIGGHGGRAPVLVGGEGWAMTGILGLHGADVDALGLVETNAVGS